MSIYAAAESRDMESDDVGGEAVRDALRKRHMVLAALSERPLEKPALVEQLPISRSTVDRSIEDLRAIGFVDRTDEGFQTTVVGELARDTYQEYVDRTDRLGAAATLLNALPDASMIDQAMLMDCTIKTPEPHAPEAALGPVIEGLRSATTLRGFAPVIRPSYVSILADHLSNDGMTIEIIIRPEVRASLSQVHNVADLKALLTADSVQLLETEATLPYALWLHDGDTAPVGLTIYGEDGAIEGLIANDTDAAVAWAEEVYTRYRNMATPTSVDPALFE